LVPEFSIPGLSSGLRWCREGVIGTSSYFCGFRFFLDLGPCAFPRPPCRVRFSWLVPSTTPAILSPAFCRSVVHPCLFGATPRFPVPSMSFLTDPHLHTIRHLGRYLCDSRLLITFPPFLAVASPPYFSATPGSAKVEFCLFLVCTSVAFFISAF